jgi:hypothetical protein
LLRRHFRVLGDADAGFLPPYGGGKLVCGFAAAAGDYRVDFGRACGWLRDRPDKDWSLTDCISFVVMEDENIKEALTADHHFEQAGFVALLK